MYVDGSLLKHELKVGPVGVVYMESRNYVLGWTKLKALKCGNTCHHACIKTKVCRDATRYYFGKRLYTIRNCHLFTLSELLLN